MRSRVVGNRYRAKYLQHGAAASASLSEIARVHVAASALASAHVLLHAYRWAYAHTSTDAYLCLLGKLTTYLPTYLPAYLPTYLPTYASDTQTDRQTDRHTDKAGSLSIRAIVTIPYWLHEYKVFPNQASTYMVFIVFVAMLARLTGPAPNARSNMLQNVNFGRSKRYKTLISYFFIFCYTWWFSCTSQMLQNVTKRYNSNVTMCQKNVAEMLQLQCYNTF